MCIRDSAFSVAGPMTWNSLTDSLRDPSLSSDSFCRQLETFCLQIGPCVLSTLNILGIVKNINISKRVMYRYADVVDGDSTEGLLHYVPYTSVR